MLKYLVHDDPSETCKKCSDKLSDNNRINGNVTVRGRILNYPQVLILKVNRAVDYELNFKNSIKVEFKESLHFENGNELVKYDLFAAINHIGSCMRDGHYVNISNTHDRYAFTMAIDFINN